MSIDVEDEFKKIMQSLSATTKEEALAQAISELSDVGKIKMFSQLLPHEDETTATLLVISDRYSLSWLKSFILEKLQLRVSLLRQGRSEYVSMISGEKKARQRFWGLFGRKEEKEENK